MNANNVAAFCAELKAQRNEALAKATRLEAERDEANAAIARIWKVLGIETYAQAGGKEISEIVADRLSRAERAEASAAAKDAALRRARAAIWNGGDTVATLAAIDAALPAPDAAGGHP